MCVECEARRRTSPALIVCRAGSQRFRSRTRDTLSRHARMCATNAGAPRSDRHADRGPARYVPFPARIGNTPRDSGSLERHGARLQHGRLGSSGSLALVPPAISPCARSGTTSGVSRCNTNALLNANISRGIGEPPCRRALRTTPVRDCRTPRITDWIVGFRDPRPARPMESELSVRTGVRQGRARVL